MKSTVLLLITCQYNSGKLRPGSTKIFSIVYLDGASARGACGAVQRACVVGQYILLYIYIPYSRVIRCISHISTYSLISAYVFVASNIHC